MDSIMPMATTKRHNKIINEFVRNVSGVNFYDVDILTSDCLLVFWGNRMELFTANLIDISQIEDIEHFREDIMNDLYCVQPDFMMFDKNKFIENKRQTRTAGFPDLTIEVWSDGNDIKEQAFKKILYSTSDTTEHWYVKQGSNDVECFLGKEALPKQSLLNILKTINGIEFDLTRRAIK